MSKIPSNFYLTYVSVILTFSQDRVKLLVDGIVLNSTPIRALHDDAWK